MRKITASVLITFITSFLSINIYAQEKGIPTVEFLRNSLNIYIGLIEFNINYERNISQRPSSLTNLRMGFGKGMFVVAGEGFYLNPSMVHLIGKKSSYLELDLGFKYIVNHENPNPRLSLYLVPDFFGGYRYEKPDGSFIFRTGINYPTLINISIGVKL